MPGVSVGAKRKRRAGGGFDDRLSDDSDFDDLRHIGGLAAGMRSASAKSVRCNMLQMMSRSPGICSL
jgi:hypothetical protein